MPLARLDHVSIRTTKLAETEHFYTTILGLETGPRPSFPFPGIWLYHAGTAVIHVVGIDPNDPAGLKTYLGDKPLESGTGTIDHVAFTGADVEAMRAHFRANNTPYRDRTVPSLNLEQIFIEDPNGVTIELNFPNA